MQILDIGCGATPKGTVNIDLYPKDRTQECRPWNPKNTQNFILTDGHELPFKDGAFETVICSHCLEHMEHPLQALEEMKRVAKNKILILVPSQFSVDDLTVTHLYTWNPQTLKQLLKKLGADIETGYSARTWFRRLKIPIFSSLMSILLAKLGIKREIYGVVRLAQT